MSEFSVHFTGGSSDQQARDTLLQILHSQTLRAGESPFGAARRLTALGSSQRSICFSEIPLDLLDRLVDRRRAYGLGFHQQALVAAGGGRVWYVDRGSPLDTQGFDALFDQKVHGIDEADPFWRITPFVDRPGDQPAYRFEWEREWRVPRLELQFEVTDVAFVFAPADQHAEIRQWFHGQSGPLYEYCPFIDPSWDIEKIQEEVADLPTVPVLPSTHQLRGRAINQVQVDDLWLRVQIDGEICYIPKFLDRAEPTDAVLRDAQENQLESIKIIHAYEPLSDA